MRFTLRLAFAIGTALAVPALAAPVQARSSAEYYNARLGQSEIPALLSREEREYYRDFFAAIERDDWARVNALLSARPDGPLHKVAIAEFYLDGQSPRVELDQITAWLASGRMLPQAEQLANLGLRRGLERMPDLPRQQTFYSQGYAPKRVRPSTISDGTMPEDIRRRILEHISADDPDGARLLLDGIDAVLSREARAEWRQRVAWSYYIENRDAAALAMARTVGQDGAGPWVAEGDWVAGLASWRLDDPTEAMAHFQRAAAGSRNAELTTAAYYWASRSAIRARYPEQSAQFLRAAASQDETLYGMLAAEQLGRSLPNPYAGADFTAEDWRRVGQSENVRIAVGLAEVGQDVLSSEVLLHEAKIGDPGNYAALSRLARDLGLPATQLYMAHNAPSGGKPDPAARYPAPRWSPVDGWKVDPALAYAHALQESNFQTTVVSPAGAKGLMQIMPIAAREHAGSLNMNASYADLGDPRVNLAFGQRNLESLRDSRATEGKLPKIMAAYNAGLTPVTRWNGEIRDQGDPLLYMESIPYWETRGYVAIVTRNYWMYERQAAAASPSRHALAEGKWPMFPGEGRSGRTYLSAQSGGN